MKTLPHVVRILLGLSLLLLSLSTASAHEQRYCTVPCGHRMHRYDIGPCGHPCYGPYGMYPCHSAGDMYPCVHPVHTFDYIPC